METHNEMILLLVYLTHLFNKYLLKHTEDKDWGCIKRYVNET